jgi:UDP-N-acetylglucosamine diphosphorylase/glucosamine-1-phosphate N-acetyltransferase
MEGCMIRGPFALCDHAQLKMGAKIYGPTTIGPNCKVGGEVNNSILTGYSSKAHDGFIGQTVIGEWCNLGADTNTSNLKNDYSPVKSWSYLKKGFIPTGQQFCGTIMGDHSKTGINTMLNTGTVVGVGCNVFGEGFPRNFIPDFSWGGKAGFATYDLSKMLAVAERVMQRRSITITDLDREILNHIFHATAEYRSA